MDKSYIYGNYKNFNPTSFLDLKDQYWLLLLFVIVWIFISAFGYSKEKRPSYLAWSKILVIFFAAFLAYDHFIKNILDYFNNGFHIAGLYKSRNIPFGIMTLIQHIFFIALFLFFWAFIRYNQKYDVGEKNIKFFTITSSLILMYMLYFVAFCGNAYSWVIVYSMIFTAPRAAGGWSVFLAYDGGSEWFKTWLLHCCLSSILFISILKFIGIGA